MSRSYSLMMAALAGAFAVGAEVRAGNRLYVGNLPSTSGFTFVDKSTDPPTALQDVSVVLQDARTGTPQNPLGTLPTATTMGIVNPDPLGLGDAAFFDVFYTGPANDFPANSFFDVFMDFTQPGTNLRARGTVRVINPAASSIAVGLGNQFAGGPELDTLLEGHINPFQQGLSFSGLQVVQGTSPDPFATSFFDIFMELRFDGSGTIDPSVPLYRITLTGVPEPATMVLLLFAVAGWCLRRRRAP